MTDGSSTTIGANTTRRAALNDLSNVSRANNNGVLQPARKAASTTTTTHNSTNTNRSSADGAARPSAARQPLASRPLPKHTSAPGLARSAKERLPVAAGSSARVGVARAKSSDIPVLTVNRHSKDDLKAADSAVVPPSIEVAPKADAAAPARVPLGVLPSETRSDNNNLQDSSSEPSRGIKRDRADVSQDTIAVTNQTAPSNAGPAMKRPKIEGPEQEWSDLDAEDKDDPLMVSEYVVEIFDFLYKLQDEYMPDANYVRKQTEFKWSMRSVLVDWLVEVHAKFRLLPETLFLAVNIFDRYMSQRDTELAKIQLIGVSSLFIAAKIEEVFCPSIGNFSYITDAYSEEEILRAERHILKVLNFKVAYPNPMNFLRRISKADNYDISTRTLGKYLLEIGLFDQRLLKYRPSELAGAAMFLARRILDRGDWNANLVHYSGDCDEESLYDILAIMVAFIKAPVVNEAFFKKYASKRFLKASIVAHQWVKNHPDCYELRSSTTAEDEDA